MKPFSYFFFFFSYFLIKYEFSDFLHQPVIPYNFQQMDQIM